MPHYIVEKIEFDFEDAFGTITEQEQEFITDNVLGYGGLMLKSVFYTNQY